MRISLLICILLWGASAIAQERSPEELYGRPAPPEDVPSQEQPPMWDRVKEALSKFVPPQLPSDQSGRPLEQTLDGSSLPTDSIDSQRQTQWQNATKLSAPDDSDADATPQQSIARPHSRAECLDPNNFQPNAAGCLDYYLFKVVDIATYDLYLEPEVGQKLFCLTNVDTDDLENGDQVVILGNVRVRGTKVYKSEQGDKITVRVVKLLDAKESELVDAERALQETEHPMRTWTSKDGKHKIEARFLKFAGGKVHLVNKAGKNLSIAPNNLSIADRGYYRDLVLKARAAARKKVEDQDQAEDTESFAGEGERLER